MRKYAELTNEQYEQILQQFYSYFKSGYAFEEFLKVYLEKIGLDEVTVTQRSRDGGIDLIAKRTGIGGFSETDEVEYYVQAKRYKPNSTIPVAKVRELKGTIPFGHKGILITTAKFSTDSIRESGNDASKPVILIGGRALIESCIEHEIGFLFVPQFSKVEMDQLTNINNTDGVSPDDPDIIVEKRISANDIRAQILRIPKVIIEKIPPNAKTYEVIFNNSFKKELKIDKYRVYFSKVIEVYRKYGLIDNEGVFFPQKSMWRMKPNGELYITLQNKEIALAE